MRWHARIGYGWDSLEHLWVHSLENLWSYIDMTLFIMAECHWLLVGLFSPHMCWVNYWVNLSTVNLSTHRSVDLRGANKLYVRSELDSNLFYHHWESIPWSDLKGSRGGLINVLHMVVMIHISPIDSWIQHDVLPNDLLTNLFRPPKVKNLQRFIEIPLTTP